VTYSYNKNQRDALFLKFIFDIELYMFRTGLLSIIRSVVLYTQQKVFVIQVMLTDLASRLSAYPLWQIPIAVYTVLHSWWWTV